MANVKNFGLVGVADNVQYGKAGPRLKHTAGAFEFRNAADGANASSWHVQRPSLTTADRVSLAATRRLGM